MAQRWTLGLWVLAMPLLVVMAVPALAEAVQPLDDAIWELAVNTQQAALVAVAKALDFIGETLVMGSLTLGVAAVLGWQRRWPALGTWVIAIAASQSMILPLKDFFTRPRPPLPLIDESSTWAFPSGHALTAAAVAITLVLVWMPAGARRRRLLIVGVTYALVMATSRVYLRAHWFTDVAEGLALGAATALAATVIVTWWTARTLD